MNDYLPYGRHHLSDDDIQAVVDTLRSGTLTQGPKILEFEQHVAAYVGARYAVAVSSGTTALHLCCVVADIGSSDLVVTSPITFVASANCAAYVGAKATFADIDPGTLNLSPDALRDVLSAQRQAYRHAAVIPVHFAGKACDMDRIDAIAKAFDAIVIEDACHAFGSTYANGKRVGCCDKSLMTVFSFHPVKAIAAGEGGMITTNDEKIYRRLLRLRSHGIHKGDDPLLRKDLAFDGDQPNPWYYEMQELGYNFRITDIQCALALSQFRKLDRFLERRAELAQKYRLALAGHHHIRVAQPNGPGESANHLFPIRVDFDAIGMTRRALMQHLKENHVGSQVHYLPVYLHPYYAAQGFSKADYPHAEGYYAQALSIPLYFDLTDAQQEHVIKTLGQFA